MKEATITVTTETVVANLTTAIAALRTLQEASEQLAPKMQGKEMNPLGPRNLIVALRQNLEAARGDIERGIQRDHRGYKIGTYSDLADIISREEDLSVIIDR